jgi:hypothetical protein
MGKIYQDVIAQGFSVLRLSVSRGMELKFIHIRETINLARSVEARFGGDYELYMAWQDSITIKAKEIVRQYLDDPNSDLKKLINDARHSLNN